MLMQSSADNREAALGFLNLVIAGEIDEAYWDYVSMEGKHHNVFFDAGFPALREAMKENQIQFPHKRMTVKNVLSDGDLVAVHSHVELGDGGPGIVAVHLFRFEDEKIAEMWDCGQSIPAESPNVDGVI
jgi:predicted SnoaL-like aldol condensation-catalyzing enzyme